jgi:hypothetical protein
MKISIFQVFTFACFLLLGIIINLSFIFSFFLPLKLTIALMIITFAYVVYLGLVGKINIISFIVFILFMLPFTVLFPYLWIYPTENSDVFWLSVSNPYAENIVVIELLSLLGLASAVGFSIGFCLSNKPRMLAHYPLTDRMFSAKISMSSLVWVFWTIGGCLFLRLEVPENNIFISPYGTELSNADILRFKSSWLFGYTIFTFSFVDAVFDSQLRRRACKLLMFFTLCFYIFYNGQFLTGNREALSWFFGISVIILYIRATSPFNGRIINFWGFCLIGVITYLLFSISSLIGIIRDKAVGLELSELIQLIGKLPANDIFGSQVLYDSTFTAVLLTPLSITGDYIFGDFSYLLGQTYIDLTLSIVPGFIAEFFGYVRPYDSTMIAEKLTFGLGGSHASVLPFWNFGIFGVLGFSLFCSLLLKYMEKKFGERVTVTNFSFYGSFIFIAPHWLWYGEKYLINFLIVFSICVLAYNLSLWASASMLRVVSKI